MSYDLDPEKRQGLLETAACEGQKNVGGFQLKPFRMGSYSFYLRLLGFLKTTPASDEHTTYCALAFVHSLPEDRLAALFARPELLVPELFAFMQRVSMQQYKEIEAWGDSQYAQWEASKTIDDGMPGGISDPKA